MSVSRRPLDTWPFDQPSPIDPPQVYAALRRDEPVCPVTMPWGDEAHLVTRHQDAQRVLTDPRFSLAKVWSPGAARFAPGPMPDTARSLPNLDPPEHTRLRRLIAPSFTPRRTEALRDDVRATTGRLLDAMAASGPPADLIEALCTPLPITTIFRLLGMPPEAQAEFRAWSDAITGVTTDTQDEWERAWRELGTFLFRLIEAKRVRPADDLLSTFVAVFDREDDLTDLQLVVLTAQLLIDGHQTTRNQLRILLYALLRRPDVYAAVCAAPRTIPDVVDELLRLHPHDEPILRAATEDADIAGVTVPAGGLVLIDPSAVNRDPDAFTAPEEQDFHRPDLSLHLTFGHGPHRCLGASLARVQLQEAVSGLADRFPTLRLPAEPPGRRSQATTSSLTLNELPVVW
uniref:cytochrome P450 n=1 Tax=Actinomadura sp. CA-154981 TaxID=3240037 RepID=UPI003F495C16